MHLFSAFIRHIKCQQCKRNACLSLSLPQLHLSGRLAFPNTHISPSLGFFSRRKINENKQAPTVHTYRSRVQCDSAQCVYQIYIILTRFPVLRLSDSIFFFVFFLFRTMKVNDMKYEKDVQRVCVCAYVRACTLIV